jgi:hypothetical protein
VVRAELIKGDSSRISQSVVKLRSRQFSSVLRLYCIWRVLQLVVCYSYCNLEIMITKCSYDC